MKKMIFILAILIPTITFAGTCETVDDTSNLDNRTLTCDSEKLTTTKYKTSNNVKVLENDVCTVTCSEEVLFSFEPIKKVIAGMSFSYPLLVSGERKCTAVYKYEAYEKKIRELVNEYSTSTGDAKTTAKNKLVNYYTEKQNCDEFNKEESNYKSEYKYDANVKIEIEKSTSNKGETEVETIDYNYVKMNDTTVIENVDNVFYDSCNLNVSNYTCNGSATTIGSWTSTTRLFGKYTMADSYVEKYTGNVIYSKKTGTKTEGNTTMANTCNAGDRYFTSAKAYTKPEAGATGDNGYKLTLIAKNLGNNLETKKTWNLNVNCWYQVKNLTNPQNDDENSDLGDSGYEYRLIDLDNPFPNREPNSNWQGKLNIITNTKDKLSTLQMFRITLDSGKINEIKSYNETNKYSIFNLTEEEKSNFIENNTNIIERK